MKQYKIVHHTLYNFNSLVKLQPHILRLRPRESHELRIESSKLDIFPQASLRWHRDVEGNSIVIASFLEDTTTLEIKSEVLIQQYDLKPLDFLVADYAVNYPFSYPKEDRIRLYPHLAETHAPIDKALDNWLSDLWRPEEIIQSTTLLYNLNQRINKSMIYQKRDEEGVQSPQLTLVNGSGSCRDFANLFMAAAHKLGFAARFVSGYLLSNPVINDSGSTHAWAEVYIPGAGWKGYDPTLGEVVGEHHVAVAVARLPEAVPPVEGSYLGQPGSEMKINVWVDGLNQAQLI